MTGVAAGDGSSGVAVGAAAVASLALGKLATDRAGSISSFFVLFVGFHALYGLSGVGNVVAGIPMHPIFSQPYAADEFLMMYALATAGLVAGASLGPRVAAFRRSGTGAGCSDASLQTLRRAAVAAAAVASVMELVNVYRVGGAAILVLGKATYQSEVEDIAFTLPANVVATFAAAALGVAASLERLRGRPRRGPGFAAFSLALAPLFVLSLFLGRRGPILDWLFTGALAATYYTPVRRLRAAIVAATAVVYLVMGYIFANRTLIGVTALTGNWTTFLVQSLSPQRLAIAVNPGATEFGAAFGNFSEYVHGGRKPLRLGQSYVRAPLSVVPGFLYPGVKPPQIWQEFRDTYFATEADRGFIAGTAYSSILEAYANFGPPGVFCVYFVVGAAAMWLERRRARTGRGALTYAMLAPAAIIFHRSDASGGLVGPVFYALALPVAYHVATRLGATVLAPPAAPAGSAVRTR
jgi:hypothetical protein